MYKNIFVLMDNSDYSHWGLDFSIELASLYGSTLIGNHVYAARLHEDRFIQMEPGLPERYQEPAELQRQRAIHGSLIEKGLVIISDSYLDVFQEKCEAKKIPFVRKMMEGKNYSELVNDIRESNYDLVAMGAKGLGEVPTTQLGSVCERVTRRIGVDTIVMKNSTPIRDGNIAVGVDGSGQSFAAMQTAIELNKRLGCKITVLAVYDPVFHYKVFQNISEVLSEEAGEIFKFKEQEALHDEIIDAGIEKIYRDHMDIAVKMAKDDGVEVETKMLPGKPYDAILNWLKDNEQSLLLLGKVGVHNNNGLDIGSNSENLLRNASCNVMLISRKVTPKMDENSGEHVEIEWEPEALQTLKRAPGFVQKMIRGHMEANARKQGKTVITGEMMEAAKKKMMGS
ncbi:MAG: universal stress protein [Nitrospinota bacterium]